METKKKRDRKKEKPREREREIVGAADRDETGEEGVDWSGRRRQ